MTAVPAGLQGLQEEYSEGLDWHPFEREVLITYPYPYILHDQLLSVNIVGSGLSESFFFLVSGEEDLGIGGQDIRL